MKKGTLALIGLTFIAALAMTVFLSATWVDPWRLAALFECLALMLGAFVAFTYTDFVHFLRKWALKRALLAFLLPFLLLLPYLLLALSTDTFSFPALAKLATYITVPTLLLLPDRVHAAESAGWCDFIAMLALGLPVAAGWLTHIWAWPQDLYVFQPLFCVCVGAYAFLVIRNLKDADYRLIRKKQNMTEGIINFIAFALVAIPIGVVLQFVHPHTHPLTFFAAADWLGIYLTIAIPEESLFRAILQNLLAKTFKGPRRGAYGLMVASLIFGLSHLHHPSVPNWRYALIATVAGLFYGNVYRLRKRTSASAFTHALVDTVWHFWFSTLSPAPPVI